MARPWAVLVAVGLVAACSCDEAEPAVEGSSGGGAAYDASPPDGDVDVDGAGGTTPVDGDADGAADDAGDTGPGFDCQHAAVVKDCKDGWCRIPAGCFIMGSPEDEWGRGAYTENEVKVTFTRSFLMKQTEVTQAQWTALGVPNPSGPPPKPDNGGDCAQPDCPVGNVNWWEAAAFANLLSKNEGLADCYQLEGCTGKVGEGLVCQTFKLSAPTIYECPGYRLPTGPEWEYAAKAGTNTSFYTGSITPTVDPYECDTVDPNLDKAGWYCGNSGVLTHLVGQKRETAGVWSTCWATRGSGPTPSSQVAGLR